MLEKKNHARILHNIIDETLHKCTLLGKIRLSHLSMIGIGVGMFNVLFVVTLYYNIINTWTLYYLGSSFFNPLPWTTCDNAWNTPKCLHQSPNSLQQNGNSSLDGMYNSSLQSSVNSSNVNATILTVIGNVSDSTTSLEEFWL